MKHPKIAYGVLLFGLLSGGGILNAISRGPAVKIYGGSIYRGVWVVGNEVHVHAAGVRARPACFGAYANRRLVTYWDPDTMLRQRDVRYIQEHDLMDSVATGYRNEWPVLHLYAPLPLDANPADWALRTEVHDNCPLIYWAFPDWLVREIVPKLPKVPPVRVTPGLPPPEAFLPPPATERDPTVKDQGQP